MDSKLAQQVAREVDARARSWYPHMSEAERAEYVATQVAIACG